VDEENPLKVFESPQSTRENSFVVEKNSYEKKISDLFINTLKEDYEQEKRKYANEVIKALKPIQQWSDMELLERFAKSRDEESEQELHRRSKGQHFIALLPGKFIPGEEEIDITLSIELLKNSRKRTNPSIIPGPDQKFLQIYKATELNIVNRIVNLCPFCGDALWKEYCPECDLMLGGIENDALSLLNFIWQRTVPKDPNKLDSGGFVEGVISAAYESLKNFGKKQFQEMLIIRARRGKNLSYIQNTAWETTYNELRKNGLLPKFRIIGKRPSVVIKQ
jgi:hypothetical protein